jgi:uncharacterized protein (DUF433 family)
MAATAEIGSLIARTPGIRGGRPCIAGTGVSVLRITGWNNLGFSPEEIAAKIPHLTLAGIHAALAYYYANREEIDADFAADDAFEEEILRQRQAERSSEAPPQTQVMWRTLQRAAAGFSPTWSSAA